MSDGLADACARYADLILQQLEALGTEDFAAFDECSAERDLIESTIEALGPVAAANPSSDEATAAAEQLARCNELDRLLIERLTALRAEAATAIAEHDERRPGMLAYGSRVPAGAGAVDIRL